MSFDWNYYLVIAKKLKTSTDGKSDNNNNEALKRTAISRAYYAVFHLAVAYAKNNFGYIPNQNGPNQSHSDIRAEYQKQLGNPDHQEIKKILARMYKARIDSDYKADSLGNTQSLLGSIILDADKIKGILS